MFMNWKNQYCQNDHLSYRFSTLSLSIFTEIEQVALKLAWKYKRLQIANNNLDKEEKNWSYHTP